MHVSSEQYGLRISLRLARVGLTDWGWDSGVGIGCVVSLGWF